MILNRVVEDTTHGGSFLFKAHLNSAFLMYRLVRATASGPRGSAPVWARKVYSTENQENTTEPPPLSITEENVLTVKRRTRKPKAPKVQVEAAPVVQPSGN